MKPKGKGEKKDDKKDKKKGKKGVNPFAPGKKC